MMKSKNLFRMAALAFVGACMVACSGNEDVATEPTPQTQPPTPNTGEFILRAEVSMGGGSTRAVDANGHTSWAVGDKVGVLYENTSLELVPSTDGEVVEVKTENETEIAVIQATLLNPGDGRSAWIITPKSQWNDGLTFHTNHLFNNQKGTLADVSANWDFAISDPGTIWIAPGNYVVRLNYDAQTKVSTPVIMRNQNCIFKLTLKNSANQPINATTLYINDGFNDYTIFNNNQAASEFYVAMLPRENKTFTFTAKASGKLYSKSYSGVTTVASNFYTSTITMDGPEGVQLWAGGPYWATMNVGASSPEEYGDYFAWGETTGYAKGEAHDFTWPNYKYANGSNNTLTKYCKTAGYGYNGFTDNLTKLEPSDDAATANWGSSWRMPTRNELRTLSDDNSTHYVTYEWTDDYNDTGVPGCILTGKGDYASHSIFLPAAGYRVNATIENEGTYGYYWSSTNDGNACSAYCAWELTFAKGYNSHASVNGNWSRYTGCMVRAVHD